MHPVDTKEILKKVRAIEIRTRRMVTDAVSGAYHSSFKGQGIDFQEVREYTPGDDVRSIDWNVTAKMDKPFVKIFQEERELTIMIVLDLSASGRFGSVDQSKREQAAEIASVLAFSATRNNDKVGLILYTDQIEQFIPAKKGRRHILRVIREMLFFAPDGKQTDTIAALQFLNRLERRRAVVFLISDFLQDGDGASVGAPGQEQHPLFRTLALTNQRHDLICVRVSDPRELEVPNIGLITLEDAETGELIEFDTGNASNRLAYRNQNRKRLETIDRTIRQYGIDSIQVSTGEPYITPLRNLFERRSQRF